MIEALCQTTYLLKSSGNSMGMNFKYLKVSIAQKLTNLESFDSRTAVF